MEKKRSDTGEKAGIPIAPPFQLMPSLRPPPPPLPSLSLQSQSAPKLNDRLKKMNWQGLQNLSKDCIWANLPSVPEEKDIFDGLKQRFSLPSIHTNKGSVAKSYISLQVLDANTAQNLLISLRTLFKTRTQTEIRQQILHCDTSILDSSLIESLVKYLPQPHIMKKLHEMNEKGLELAEVEKFVAILGDIERLVPRLNCIKFKVGFDELVKDLKPYLKVEKEACADVSSSDKFAKILKLILSIGNFMNSGSGEASGFELAILTKLHEIKSSNNNQTLFHFIVETIERKFPELLNFGEEIASIDHAVRLSCLHINETIQGIATLSKSVQEELEFCNASEVKLAEDKFVEIMTPFAVKCQDHVRVLTKMLDDMKDRYSNLARYFAFDVSKFQMEKFFSTINIFKTQFGKILTEIKQDPAETAKDSPIVDVYKTSSADDNPQPTIVSGPPTSSGLRKCKVNVVRLTKEEIATLTNNKFGKRKRDQCDMENIELTPKRTRILRSRVLVKDL